MCVKPSAFVNFESVFFSQSARGYLAKANRLAHAIVPIYIIRYQYLITFIILCHKRIYLYSYIGHINTRTHTHTHTYTLLLLYIMYICIGVWTRAYEL